MAYSSRYSTSRKAPRLDEKKICKMLFNTNWKPDCYAWAILMLLGPRNLRSTELKCWEDCYDFLDFAEDKDNDGKEEGMFKPVFYVPVDGESKSNVLVSNLLGNLIRSYM